MSVGAPTVLDARLSRRVHDALTVDATIRLGDEIGVLFGRSGAGKSTLLRMIAGLSRPDSGIVSLAGETLYDSRRGVETPLRRRRIGMIFQDDLLFPHLDVAGNVGFGLRGASRGDRARRLEEVATLCGVSDLLGRRIDTLSGGERQRVGLARALAGDPDILLMDEPFGAVDPIIRRDLRAELRRIHAETGKTILLVTHDPVEALELATQIVVLRGGRVAAAGSPISLTDPGADPFTRDLFGGEALALRRLHFTRVDEVMGPPLEDGVPTVNADATLSEALARIVETRAARLSVTDVQGRPVGSLAVEDLVERYR